MLIENVSVVIDVAVYSREVALKAAYALSDRYVVRLGAPTPQTLLAEITPIDSAVDMLAENIRAEFQNTLTDFALRSHISAETREIQKILLQRAFAQSLPKAR